MTTTVEQYVSQYDGADGLKKEKTTISSVGDDEVLVEIKTVALNYRDTEVIHGEYGLQKAFGVGPPVVPCSDMCGVVVSVGSKATKWQVGDRVLSTFVPNHKTGTVKEEYLSHSVGWPQAGVLATHRVFQEDALIKAPEQMTDQEACTLPISGVTAWMALNGARSGAESDLKDLYVLLQGTGGVSIAGLQLAKAAGAKVVITSSSDDKLARAKDLGADFTINYKTHPDWEKHVMEATNKHGADIILETGGSETLGKSFSSAAFGGLINCIGYTSGKTQAAGEQPNVNVSAISRCLTLKGIINGPIDCFEKMARFMEKHEIHPVVCKVFSFNEVKEAFKYMESGSHFGKIVVQVTQS